MFCFLGDYNSPKGFYNYFWLPTTLSLLLQTHTNTPHLVQRPHQTQLSIKSLYCPPLNFKISIHRAEEEGNGFWQSPIDSNWFYSQGSLTGATPRGGVKHVIYLDCASCLKSLIITGSVTTMVRPGLRSMTGKRERQHDPHKHRPKGLTRVNTKYLTRSTNNFFFNKKKKHTHNLWSKLNYCTKIKSQNFGTKSMYGGYSDIAQFVSPTFGSVVETRLVMATWGLD